MHTLINNQIVQESNYQKNEESLKNSNTYFLYCESQKKKEKETDNSYFQSTN